MATVTGLTAARMLEIENASVVNGTVDGAHNLILTTKGGTPINAGYVKGTPGAPGGTDESFGDWIDNPASLTSQALGRRDKATLSERVRLLGTRQNMVVIGASTSTPGTWINAFASYWGLTSRNYAVGGASFDDQGVAKYLTQLQSAGADPAFSNSEVALVIFGGAGNTARRWNDTGFQMSVRSEADACFAYAKTTFPNARIICIPMFWPSNPQSITGDALGGQKIWNEAVIALSHELREACNLGGVEFVDYSWTWLTGKEGVMEAGGGIHPNAAGYAETFRWMCQAIRYQPTRQDMPWREFTLTNATPWGTAGGIRVRREGWNVVVKGGVSITAATTGGFSDFGILPAGYRPPYEWDDTARSNSSVSPHGLHIYRTGVLRIWTNLAAGANVHVYTTFPLG